MENLQCGAIPAIEMHKDKGYETKAAKILGSIHAGGRSQINPIISQSTRIIRYSL
jgi:hypothetical protein